MPARRDLLLSALGLGAALALSTSAWAEDAPAAPAAEAGGIAEMTMGSPDAPITMIEYASFTCPHCADFHENVLKDIKKTYIDTGKVRLIYREVYFDRYGLAASMIARCDGGLRFFGLADRLYATQGDWARGSDPAAIGEALRKIGLTSGLTKEQVDACLADQTKAKALVDWYSGNAKRDGIESTPSFLIDGVKYSNMAYERFAEIFDGKLGQ